MLTSIKLILLYSTLNTGEGAHIQQIANSLNQYLKPCHTITIDANSSAFDIQKRYETEVKDLPSPSEQKIIILSAGEKGGSALETLVKSPWFDSKQTYIYWGTHQFTPQITKHKSYNVDHLMIPSSAIKNEEQKTLLEKAPFHSFTFAVPSQTLSLTDLKTSYETWRLKNKPSLKSKYLIVLLPGDAPDEEGALKYFTKESAEELFEKVYHLWKKLGSKQTLLIENSPRTGKYNPTNGQIDCTHEYKKGESASIAIDKVSLHFLSLLDKRKIPYRFFNFAIEQEGIKKTVLSDFNPLLFVAKKTDSYFILPGESVTLLGQIPLYLNPKKIIIFQPSSMNSSHHSVYQEGLRRGYYSFFNQEGSFTSPAHPKQRRKDDSQQVAWDIYQGIQKKFHMKKRFSSCHSKDQNSKKLSNDDRSL